MLASTTHLVLIPSYNPGPAVFETVRGACAVWSPVWVVVDGSTDGTLEGLRALTAELPQLRVLALPQNCGKGAAVLEGLRHAEAAGFYAHPEYGFRRAASERINRGIYACVTGNAFCDGAWATGV